MFKKIIPIFKWYFSNERKVLNALLRLRKAVLLNTDDYTINQGICHNTVNYIDDYWEYRVIRNKLFVNFLIQYPLEHPKNVKNPSEQLSYPVEGTAALFGYHAAYQTLWDNPRRRLLLDFMIDELSKEKP